MEDGAKIRMYWPMRSRRAAFGYGGTHVMCGAGLVVGEWERGDKIGVVKRAILGRYASERRAESVDLRAG